MSLFSKMPNINDSKLQKGSQPSSAKVRSEALCGALFGYADRFDTNQKKSQVENKNGKLCKKN